MFDHMSKGLKVPGLVGISCIWGHSEPHTRGQTTSEVAKNWRPVRFWPKINCGVEGVFPKKIWAGLVFLYPCSSKAKHELRLRVLFQRVFHVSGTKNKELLTSFLDKGSLISIDSLISTNIGFLATSLKLHTIPSFFLRQTMQPLSQDGQDKHAI